jgi:hypothetical protein
MASGISRGISSPGSVISGYAYTCTAPARAVRLLSPVPASQCSNAEGGNAWYRDA